MILEEEAQQYKKNKDLENEKLKSQILHAESAAKQAKDELQFKI